MDNELTGVLTDQADTDTETSDQTSNVPGAEGQRAAADAVAQARAELEAEANARWQAEVERQQAEASLQPWREAWEAANDPYMPDHSKLGELTRQALTEQMQAQKFEQAAGSRIGETLDAIANAQFPEAVASVTPEESAAMHRSNFSSDQEWAQAGFDFLAQRQQELSGAGGAGKDTGSSGLTPAQMKVAGLDDSEIGGGESYSPSSGESADNWANDLRHSIIADAERD